MTKKTKSETGNNKGMTEVKITYARVAVILLALNFALTGYIVQQVLQMQTDSMALSKGVTYPATAPSTSEESPSSPANKEE